MFEEERRKIELIKSRMPLSKRDIRDYWNGYEIEEEENKIIIKRKRSDTILVIKIALNKRGCFENRKEIIQNMEAKNYYITVNSRNYHDDKELEITKDNRVIKNHLFLVTSSGVEGCDEILLNSTVQYNWKDSPGEYYLKEYEKRVHIENQEKIYEILICKNYNENMIKSIFSLRKYGLKESSNTYYKFLKFIKMVECNSVIVELSDKNLRYYNNQFYLNDVSGIRTKKKNNCSFKDSITVDIEFFIETGKIKHKCCKCDKYYLEDLNNCEFLKIEKQTKEDILYEQGL